jgi:putative lipoprotein
MKRLALVVFSVGSVALPKDSWFGPDKVKHFFLGAFVQSAAFGTLQATGLSRNTAIAGASATTLGLSVAKELHDRSRKGTPSLRDVAWGLAGAAAVSPLLLRTK